jgi:hypothetical protein
MQESMKRERRTTDMRTNYRQLPENYMFFTWTLLIPEGFPDF